MDNFNNIKDIWQSQSNAPVPTLGKIVEIAKKSRRQMIRKNVLAVIMMSATLAFIIFIGLHYEFQFITTKIGILLTIISVIGALVVNSQLLTIMPNNANNTTNNVAYMQQLILYRNKQRFFQTTGISIYFILLSAGIFLYMYEFAVRSLSFGIISYSITLAWIAFNWFYIRPKTIKKQEKKINELISQIEAVSKQLI